VTQDRYKRQLQEKEQVLLSQLTRAGWRVREDGSGDVAREGVDASVEDERKDDQFRNANLEWTTLSQVREALQRIEEGTFGACIVDGEPIEEKRLAAIPWTAYCLRHQEEREKVEMAKLPRL